VKPFVGLDVDGVVAGFGTYVCQELGLDPDKLTTWDYASSYSREVAKQVYRLIDEPATWVGVPVLPGWPACRSYSSRPCQPSSSLCVGGGSTSTLGSNHTYLSLKARTASPISLGSWG